MEQKGELNTAKIQMLRGALGPQVEAGMVGNSGNAVHQEDLGNSLQSIESQLK